MINSFCHQLTGTYCRGPLCPYRATLTTWNYSGYHKEAVKYQKLGIENTLTQTLAEQYRKEFGTEEVERTAHIKARVAGWLIWALLVGGIMYGVVQLVVTLNNQDGLLADFAVAATIAAINAVMPQVFKTLSALEDYATRSGEVQVEIIRTFLLRMLGIFAVLYGLLRDLKISSEQLPAYDDASLVPWGCSDANVSGDQGSGSGEFSCGLGTVAQESCAGTVVGQEFYKLALIDMAFSILSEVVVYYGTMCAKGDLIEMDIAQSVITLCYRQGLIAVGMPFCPLLPLIGIIAAIGSFYTYYLLVLKTCRPPSHLQKAWQSGADAVFIGCLATTLVTCAAPLCYILRVYSPNCGAFAGYSTAFEGLEKWARPSDDENSSGVHTFLLLFIEPIVLYPIIMLLAVLLLNLREHLKEAKDDLEQLHNELAERGRAQKSANVREYRTSAVDYTNV